jgi:uncharacterized protein YdeI (YjbR/CyaY-like superfamily)
MKVQYFKDQAALRRWLEKNGAKAKEIWIGFYKKDSGKVGITYAQALDEALCFGWIDGIKKSVDELSYTNRFTPRSPKGKWSKINTGHIERLTKAGMMMPAGLAEVERAKKDGRWAMAYDSARNSAPPKDFLAALKKNKKAASFFATLNRANLYAITYRLQNAKKTETRARWIERIVAMLAEGKKFH